MSNARTFTAWQEVMDRWPDLHTLAADVGVTWNTCRMWYTRGKVPVSYWKRLLAAARRRRITGVTAKYLIDIVAVK